MTDLHTHSICSDGSETPAALIEECLLKGVDTVSLTDHDTTAGVAEAAEAGKKSGVFVIPGIELSCETDYEIHILGYHIDPAHEFFTSELAAMREERRTRTVRMIQKLNDLGADLTYEDVLQKARGESIGRPHIGAALVEKGFVKDLTEAFEKYLMRGAPAYVHRVKMTPKKAIDIIRQAGGIPVLAHPLLTGLSNIRPLIRELMDYGLMGIEAYYPAHTDGQCIEYESIAMQNGLFITCGSDFHGTVFDSGLGSEKRSSGYLQKCLGKIMEYTA